MKSILRALALLTLVLLIPILPFLAFGERLESWLERENPATLSAPATAAVIVGLLATDIVLPVPSSVISTLGGWRLGWIAGTLTSCLGMTLGAGLGFWLARQWGRPIAAWLSNEQELERMQALSARYGAAVLVVARGIPVLAEASVLLMGVHRMPWRTFLPSVLLSNLGISLAYSAFGELAERHQWMPLALGVAIALPVLLAALARRWFRD